MGWKEDLQEAHNNVSIEGRRVNEMWQILSHGNEGKADWMKFGATLQRLETACDELKKVQYRQDKA